MIEWKAGQLVEKITASRHVRGKVYPILGTDRVVIAISQIVSGTLMHIEDPHALRSQLIHTHVKTGGRYAIIGKGLMEGSEKPAVIYQSVEYPEAGWWIRPETEFYDGRFVAATAEEEERKSNV